MEKIGKVLSEEQLVAIAKETGFAVYHSKKINAISFLKLLLFDQLHYNCPTLQQHLYELYANNEISLTREGLNKRFNEKALKYVEKVFNSYLNTKIKHDQISTKLSEHFSAIRILDSTEFKLPNFFIEDFPGYGLNSAAPSCAAIQFEYEMLSKEINCIEIGNAKESDKTFADDNMDNLKLKELLLRDLGYYSLKSYLQIENKGAFYISRLKAQVSIFELINGEYILLPLKELLRRIEKSSKKCFEATLYIGSKEKKEVRLLAWLLPEDAQNNRLKKRKNKKGKTNAEDLIWSKINVSVTNIKAEVLDIQEIYELYSIRWQVELMFKTWKSILKMDHVRKMKVERLQCYIYTKLLWVLLFWDITSVLEPIIWAKKTELISIYKCFDLLKASSKSIKDSLMKASDELKEWLKKVQDYIEIFGIKDNKKGRKKVVEILKYNTPKPIKNAKFASTK